MPVAETHPPADELAAFSFGTLRDESSVLVAAHLERCESCQAAAAGLPGDSLVELLRRAHASGGLGGPAPAADTPAPMGVGSTTLTLPAGTTGDGTAADVPAELLGHERYRVLRAVGAGGMGVVYAAEHRVLKRPVALKVINRAYTANAAAVERFRREVRAAASLSHPNIVTTHDAEDAGDRQFLVMEYVDGVSLGQLVKRDGPLPVAAACDAVRQAALGLQHAHGRGMVHRDVKPGNLIRCGDGTVKVIDFGLAALAADRGGGLTEANVVMGTPDYMAPEQAADPRAADTRADVYSLGCTLFHLLAGTPPYPAATSMARLIAHREQPVPSVRRLRPDVPPALDRLVARLMAKDPADRFQTPGEAAAALEQFTRPAGPVRRRFPWTAALLFAAVVLAAGAVYRIQTDQGELVITAESEDVEVIVRQNGRVVRVVDTKTDREIALRLRSGQYELELTGAPEGLRLTVNQATLTRGEKTLAKIERVTRPQPAHAPAALEAERTLACDTDNTVTVAFSPDSSRVFAGGDSGKAWVWDVATGKRLASFAGMGWVHAAVFTADGQRVFCGDNAGVIHCWDVASGKRLRKTLTHAGGVIELRILPDGKRLMSSGTDRVIRLAELDTGREIRRWDNLPIVTGTILNPAGTQFYCWGEGREILSLDVDTGKRLRVLTAGSDGGHSSSLAPADGELPVLDWHTQTIHWLDLARNKTVRQTTLTGAEINCVVLDADRKVFVTKAEPGADRSVVRLHALDGRELARLDIPRKTAALRLSPDGRYAGLGGFRDGVFHLIRLRPPADPKP